MEVRSTTESLYLEFLADNSMPRNTCLVCQTTRCGSICHLSPLRSSEALVEQLLASDHSSLGSPSCTVSATNYVPHYTSNEKDF